MKNKIAAVVLSGLLALGAVACDGGGTGGTVAPEEVRSSGPPVS